jgi:hypothetical protein
MQCAHFFGQLLEMTIGIVAIAVGYLFLPLSCCMTEANSPSMSVTLLAGSAFVFIIISDRFHQSRDVVTTPLDVHL